MDTMPAASDYPAALDVDYPDRPLNRLTTFFRAFTIIPIAIVLATVSGATQVYSDGGTRIERDRGRRRRRRRARRRPAADDPLPSEVSALVVRLEPRADPLLLARLASTPRCSTTAIRRPTSTRPLRLDLRYPDVPNELNRWLPLVKWLLAIPHYIVLGVPRGSPRS